MFRKGKESEDEKVTIEQEERNELIESQEFWLKENKVVVEQVIIKVHALAGHAKRSHMGNTEMMDAIKNLEAETVELLEKLL